MSAEMKLEDVQQAAASVLAAITIAKAIPTVAAEYDFDHAEASAKILWSYLFASQPSRDAVIEECAALCDAEADKRFDQARMATMGDTSWGIDTAASAIAQDNKAITARSLASALRALKATP